MLEDCEAGKIDIILTKSISRFARNTVDLLETVRHLKELGIEVRFEKEHINSLSGDGEVMLTLLASFAQEEVRSLSENVKWGTRKRFEQGMDTHGHQIAIQNQTEKELVLRLTPCSNASESEQQVSIQMTELLWHPFEEINMFERWLKR